MSDEGGGLWAKDSLWDYQVGHLTSVANGYYGLRVDMLKPFSVQSLTQFYKLSQAWYDFWKPVGLCHKLPALEALGDSDLDWLFEN